MSAESVRIVEQIEELIRGWYAVKIWKSIAFEYDDELELNQYDLYTVIVKNQDGLIVAEGGDTILSEAIDTAYRNTLEMAERESVTQ
jgi:histidinol phosphatase-like enzyme